MDKKNVIIFLGSPRLNGNSAVLAGQAAEGARSCRAEVEQYFIQEMNIQFCKGCGGCKPETKKECVIQDELSPILKTLRTADAIVFASPIYWAHVTAQTKMVLDRCYSLGGTEGHDMNGKRYGIILTYANTDPFKSGTINAIRTFKESFSNDIIEIITANVFDTGEINGRKDILKRAYELGRNLVN